MFSHRDRVRLKLALATLLATLEHHRALLEQKREDLAVMLNEITFFEQQCRQQLASQRETAVDRQK